ncbi:ABC transporter permease [Opitutus sp. GAS368]|uniref:ABC transporter permease n=1 Tax=Opitutus sp. GAS368 TaxID=1882749 RepID=UPI0008799E88|nr:ABC transporter permease [Opitutus sp. GAS368]SDR72097.1 ABC-2 type transport system permease protein [Opitutus sp. GAS368]
MRHYFTIFSLEVRTLLYSPSTYIAAVFFLGVMGFFFSNILEIYSKAPQETPPAVVFFQVFWFPVLFMVPLLTMKTIADERRQGTLETLLTTPVNTAEVVLGKFSAAYLFYLLLWGSTLGFHYLLQLYARDSRYLDPAPLLGGYLFIAVSGLLFIAIGILASSMTRSQPVAGIFTVVLLILVILGPRYLGEISALNAPVLNPVKSALDSLQIFTHVEDFTHGIIDTRQLFYYLTGSALALLFSILGVEAKLLNG